MTTDLIRSRLSWNEAAVRTLVEAMAGPDHGILYSATRYGAAAGPSRAEPGVCPQRRDNPDQLLRTGPV